jgi:hypothetical protein
MQVTVSGIMLEKVLQTYSLLFRDHDDDSVEREQLPGVMMNNTLGSSIDIEVYDSTTSEILMSLKDGETKGIPCLQTRKELKYGISGSSTSSAVDLHFLGEFGKERLDLHHLPFNVNKPHTYSIQPRLSLSGGGIPSVILEPIVEEVFENSRYVIRIFISDEYCICYFLSFCSCLSKARSICFIQMYTKDRFCNFPIYNSV